MQAGAVAGAVVGGMAGGLAGAARRALAAAVLVLAAGIPAASAERSGRCPDAFCGPGGALHAALATPALSERIHAWGRPVGEIRHDLERLGAGEHRRLAAVLEAYRAGPADPARDAEMAMYLVTVSLMRESRLFASIVSSFRR